VSDDLYLLQRYVDGRRRYEKQRRYHGDGRVEIVEGEDSRVRWHFDADQVAAAKEAIRASGLCGADDLERPADTNDTAALSHTWWLDGEEGTVTNRAYPAERHPAQDALAERLRELERAADAARDA
jgi:hypothetical protein